jgi:hypothetical protein
VKAESVLLLVRRYHPEHRAGDRNEVGSASRHGIGDPGAVGRRKVGEYPAPPEKGDAVEGAVVRLLHREQATAHGLAHSHRRSHIDRRDLRIERAASQLIEDGDSRCVVGRRQLLIGQRQHVLGMRAVTGRQVVTGHEHVSGFSVERRLAVARHNLNVEVAPAEASPRPAEEDGGRAGDRVR